MEQKTILRSTEVAFAKCECCGLTEECTDEYIKRVRDRYSGRWICGLCSEAVKDELLRSSAEKKIGNEEALNQHMSFCKKFRTLTLSPPENPTEELISAVKQLLFKSLDSPRSSPVKKPGFGFGSPRSSPVKKVGFGSLDEARSSPVKKPGFGFGFGSPRSSPVKKVGFGSLDEAWSGSGKRGGVTGSENCFPGRILDKFNEK